MNFQAGYILDCFFERTIKDEKYCELLKHNCSFTVESNCIKQFKEESKNPLLIVLNNMLQRGYPTKMPWEIIENFEAIGLIKIIQEGVEYKIEIENQKLDLFYLIDPRLKVKEIKTSFKKSWENMDSKCEEDFYYKTLPSKFGEWFIQLVQKQRKINTLTTLIEEINLNEAFVEQEIDFTIEFPYYLSEGASNKRGLIIEVDGLHHNITSQIDLDNRRDSYANRRSYKVARIPVNSLESQPITWGNSIFSFEHNIYNKSDEYFQILKRNYEENNFSAERINQYEVTLSPLAIARIHKVLIEYFLQNPNEITKEKIEIIGIERDVPCINLAIESFKAMYCNLCVLANEPCKIPEFNVIVYCTNEFQKSRLHSLAHNVKNIQELPSSLNSDLVIDVSILLRNGLINTDETHLNSSYIRIRTAHSTIEHQRFYSTSNIHYNDIGIKGSDLKWIFNLEKENALKYFLKNIFRKNAFKEGQMEVLQSSLSAKPTIGLLPTGGGKSLIYQFTAILQPGFTIVIDPIKSLMFDQIDELTMMGFGNSAFINASLTPSERINEIFKIKNCKALIILCSPERMIIQEFRDILQQSYYKKHNYFTLAVIDEVHCLSEWGHDFRTAYLRLGINLLIHCRTCESIIPKGQEFPDTVVPILALTATASFDVLADVQRELTANYTGEQQMDENSIISFEKGIIRENLTYRIRYSQPNEEEIKTKENFGKFKQKQVAEIINNLNIDFNLINQAKEFDEGTKNKIAGIIFCPHKSWYFGVTDKYKNPPNSKGVYDNLESPELNGTYLGSGDNELSDLIDKENQENQKKFKANILKRLVATKAFGMGINKPDIRYTIHINFPQSIEGWVQEAGRAGRDKKNAIGYLLYSKTDFEREFNYYFHNNSYKGIRKEVSVINNILKSYQLEKKKGEIVSLPFEDEKAKENSCDNICKLLSDFLNDSWWLTQQSIFKRGWDDDFDKMLIKISNDNGGFKEKLTSDQIEKLYNSSLGYYSKNDLDKAIFRLVILGLIGDIVADYNSKHYYISITSGNYENYLKCIEQYLKRYYSDNDATNEIKKLKKKKTIDELIHYLVKFADETIAKKRRASIDTFETIAKEGIRKESETQLDADNRLKILIDLYFNAKYYREEYKYSLTNETAKGTISNFELIDRWIKNIPYEDMPNTPKENFKHLWGTTFKLLNEKPDNFTCLILYSYSLFYLNINEGNDEQLILAKESFIKGIFIALHHEDFKGKDNIYFVEKTLEVSNQLYEKTSNNKIKTIFEEIIEIIEFEYHTKWLQQFNKTFLKDYDKGNTKINS